jgi:hypothetical protein
MRLNCSAGKGIRPTTRSMKQRAATPMRQLSESSLLWARHEAVYRIVPANGIKDTALGSRPEKCGIEQFYREPERRYLVPCPQPNYRLGLCQASSEHPVRRSSGGHRNRRLPGRATASRTGSSTPASLGPRLSLLRTNSRPRTRKGNGLTRS